MLIHELVCLYWLGALQKFVKDVNGEEESKPKHEEPSTLEEEEHETGYYKLLAPRNFYGLPVQSPNIIWFININLILLGLRVNWQLTNE